MLEKHSVCFIGDKSYIVVSMEIFATFSYGHNLLSMCGESKQDIVLLSDANKLEVSIIPPTAF